MNTRELQVLAAQVETCLRGIRQILRRPLEAQIARGGLTAPQFAAVRALVRATRSHPPGGVTLKHLSNQLGLAHSTVSGIVDRLERRGIVARRADPNDRRSSRIVLTRPVLEYIGRELPAI